MLTCEQVTLTVRDEKLFDISVTLFPGSISIIRGQNGSGKSSFLRMLAGVQQLSSGRILVGDTAVSDLQKPYAVYVGHLLGLKEELTVLENLSFAASIYNSDAMILSAVHYFQLGDVLDDRVLKLSAGNRQKVAMARLLSCNADIWILDEIESHLDEHNVTLLSNAIITKANNGGIIVMSSHRASQFTKAIEINIGETCA